MKNLATQSVVTRYNSRSTLHSAPSCLNYIHPRCCLIRPGCRCFLYYLASSSHPGSNVLTKLLRSSVITCPMATDDSLCHTCQLGWHITLSSSRVVRPFYLIHCDLWTSPIISVSDYKYYLVILDDCTHYALQIRHILRSFSLLRLRVHTIWLHHPECPVR
jgi:hypothetical protein